MFEGDLVRAPCSRNKRYSLEEIRTFAGDLLNSLHELHKLDIVHGDVKFGNIFKKENRYYLGDFGLSFKESEDVDFRMRGTNGWLPPETNVKKNNRYLGSRLISSCAFHKL